LGIEELLASTGIMVLIWAVAAGALLELDEYFIIMSLVSQPIISGAVAGYIFGDIKTGILLGTLVQLIWMSPPVGAYVPPSSSAIAFLSTACAIIMADAFPEAGRNSVFMYSLAAGTGCGYFIGQMDIWNRKLNTRILHLFENKLLEGKEVYIHALQGMAIFAKLARDLVFFTVAIVGGIPVAAKIFASLPGELMYALQLSFWAMPLLGFGVVFVMFTGPVGGRLHGIVLLSSYLVLMFYREINTGLFLMLLVFAGGFVVYNSVWRRSGA